MCNGMASIMQLHNKHAAYSLHGRRYKATYSTVLYGIQMSRSTVDSGFLSACAYFKNCKKYALKSPLRLKILEN